MMPLKSFVKELQNEKRIYRFFIRSDSSGEFEIHAFESFCNNFGIEHEFSSPRTLQQNRVAERKIGLFKKSLELY